MLSFDYPSRLQPTKTYQLADFAFITDTCLNVGAVIETHRAEHK